MPAYSHAISSYLCTMARILAIDYGGKRCGVAVTDPMQIIATGLKTVPTQELMPFIKDYVSKETVETFVIGEPRRVDDTLSASAEMVHNFVKFLQRTFPHIPVELVDESYSSKRAVQSLVQSGMKKKDRQKKENLDVVAATIILQDYLESKER